jgi:3D (Asp-Asp-Asp) domain-containing protein
MKRTCSTIFLAILLFGSLHAQTHRPGRTRAFQATAYTQRRVTASGERSQTGVVAADPRTLPLGTKIQVRNAGPYSGIYIVADTGSRVQGRRIDIFIPNQQRAKKFGRRVVEVKVLRWGAAPETPLSP